MSAFPYPLTAVVTASHADGDRKVMVRERAMVADRAVELVFAAEDGAPLPPWQPGAHIDLVLDSSTIRQYSLCGDPDDRNTYRVAVLHEPHGRGGSARIHDEMRVGDTVVIRGPRNHFRLEESASYVFIAGGIGITPLLPMIRRVSSAGSTWRLHYAGRQRSTMAYLPELEELGRAADGHQRVHVSPSAEVGRIDLDAVLGGGGPGLIVYCCGPESLLDAVEDAANGRSLLCRTERFVARTIADATNTPFAVRLATTGIELAVPADRPLLDVLFDADVDVLTSCEEGTCGTCEVGVLEGVPDHRDSVLTAEEQASCDRMMVCVSRSRTPRLVLNL